MIPESEEIYLPLLKTLADGKEHTMSEVLDALADYFGLTEEEKVKTFPGKRQKMFYFRVYWAIIHLRFADLIKIERRNKIGYRWITEKGLELLSKNPEKIDYQFLYDNYPEFKEWRDKSQRLKTMKRKVVLQPDGSVLRPPRETIKDIISKYKARTKRNLLNALIKIPTTVFGKLVIDILNVLGYHGFCEEINREYMKKGGLVVDGIVRHDNIDMGDIYVRAKFGDKHIVKKPEIEAFVNSVIQKKGQNGIFITTAIVSKEAKDYTEALESPKITIIDRRQIMDYMFDHKIGLKPEATFEILTIDSDYFKEA